MAFEWTDRQRRWLDALIILATIALAFVVLGVIGELFFSFGDIVLVFFLAWLLAFILSPIVGAVDRAVPGLPRIAAVVIVYTVLLAGLILLAILLATALSSSISNFVAGIPTFREQLPALLQPWQERLNGIGLDQVDLISQANNFLDNLQIYGNQLIGPLQQLAVASLGALGSLLLVLILSLYMVADRDGILAFLFRLVPPGRKEEARLLERSIARSFGGFLRGQAILGITYGTIALVASAVGGLSYVPVTSIGAGALMAIPFFGPFVSWAPPVLVALFTAPGSVVPVLAIMIVGWFVVMNVIQPRLMQEAVGIHPIVVLGSVLVGSKIAGITGAIFGIPVAAVLSAFFLYYVGQSHDARSVTNRAARRLEAREGRSVRVPREPDPGVDPDVDEAVASPPSRTGLPRRRPTIRGPRESDPMQAHPLDRPTPLPGGDPDPGPAE